MTAYYNEKDEFAAAVLRELISAGHIARVGRLRCYGNAIVAPQAQLFIEEVMLFLSDDLF